MPKTLTLVSLFAVLSWAMPAQDDNQTKRTEDDRVRAAAFRYYSGLLLGIPEQMKGATRFPLQVVRDGKVAPRTEQETVALSKRIASTSGDPLTKDERDDMMRRMLQTFEQADIAFLGASTATTTFLVRPPARPGEGESLCQLLLHRSNGAWQVIAEVSDSQPVPPAYLSSAPTVSEP